MKHRKEFYRLIDDHGLRGIGVEVGTAAGDFAQLLLLSGLSQLYCIDSWPNPNESNNKAQAHKLADNNERLTIIEEDSLSAAKLFDNESLDFVYIDAMHEYHKVRRDIEGWFPKVKPGGIFAGHDYCVWNPAARTECGVFLAVEEYFQHHEIHVTNCLSTNYIDRLRTATLLPRDSGYMGDNLPSFWIIK